ncbi:Ig-like domain-containing protein [Brevibacillus centrosporus]|uniref:Ig-like domain-containing protein n=1 Tax=Brevibacillus centrosporus TaxID=54910 RepID=UPI00114308C1|nr:Ig-like domain-containing protein [Brevibacillus centrosporus]MEC2129552.1 Ig-like domain-containing protein [Brevibacillus centrosporus]GED29906.1 hypothetical protein BCE02nite_10470 [Brevibacillus centrosporus]
MKRDRKLVRGWQKAMLAAVLTCGVVLAGAGQVPVYAKTEKTDQTQKKISKLSASATSVKLKKDGTQQLALTVTYTDKTKEDVTQKADWTSSDSEVATVEAGLVTAVDSGKTKVKASYGGKNVTLSVEVDIISKLAVDQKKLTLREGATQQITATATYSDKSTAIVTEGAEWFSGDSEVVTVENGLVTAVGSGKTKVSVKYGGKTVTLPVEVDIISKLAVDQKKLVLRNDETKQIAATATYTDKKTANVTEEAKWTSADSEVVTVDKGLVTAIGPGKTKVSVTYGGKTVTLPVEVDVISKLALDKKVAYVHPGKTESLKLTASLSNGDKVDVTEKAEWTTSNPEVATVEGGVVTGVGAGKAKLTAKYGGKTVTISVESAVLSKLEADTKQVTLKEGETKELKASALYTDKTKADVTLEADWTSVNQKVATVEGGKITAVKAGRTNVIVTYNGKMVSVSVTVK